jgi:hypothetical protein
MGFDVTSRSECLRLAPKGSNALIYRFEFLAQELPRQVDARGQVPPKGCPVIDLLQIDAHQRIGFDSQEKKAVIVAWSLVEEFREIHRSPLPLRRVGGRPSRREGRLMIRYDKS